MKQIYKQAYWASAALITRHNQRRMQNILAATAVYDHSMVRRYAKVILFIKRRMSLTLQNEGTSYHFKVPVAQLPETFQSKSLPQHISCDILNNTAHFVFYSKGASARVYVNNKLIEEIKKASG